MDIKKVMFFLSNLNGGGAQRTIVNIINKINRNKFEPILVVLDLNKEHPYYKHLPMNLKIININRRAKYSVFKIAKILKDENPDTILSTLSQVNIAVSMAHMISGIRAKLILRETTHRKKSSMNFIKYYLSKWCYNYCNQIVALSEGVSHDIESLYGVEKEKITVIYNPINIDEIVKKGNENYDLPDADLKIVACGRLEEEKNFVLLLEALAEFNKEYEDWNLHILGEGSLEKDLKKIAINNNIDNKVYFVGFQDNPYKFMNRADLFVLTSKREGFGHVIVEAMATGTPVLASKCPHGPREILDNGSYGLLFENNNRKDLVTNFKKVYYNNELLSKLRLLSKERAETFNINKIVDEYENIFT